MTTAEVAALVLPSALVTRADLARMVRELEDVDNELEAQKARQHDDAKANYHVPSITQTLSDFVELNKINLLDDQARMLLKKQLKTIKDKTPVIHLTFAVEADLPSLRQLAEYIRKEFHPQALLHIGLQPALVGGVYMRTPNHVHDMSIRAKLQQSRSVISQDMDQLMHTIPVAEAPTAVAEPEGQA